METMLRAPEPSLNGRHVSEGRLHFRTWSAWEPAQASETGSGYLGYPPALRASGGLPEASLRVAGRSSRFAGAHQLLHGVEQHVA